MMTKKDYIAIAAALKECQSFEPNTQAATDWNLALTAAAKHIADAMARENPNFDRSRFLNACRNEPWKLGTPYRWRDRLSGWMTS